MTTTSQAWDTLTPEQKREHYEDAGNPKSPRFVLADGPTLVEFVPQGERVRVTVKRFDGDYSPLDEHEPALARTILAGHAGPWKQTNLPLWQARMEYAALVKAGFSPW